MLAKKIGGVRYARWGGRDRVDGGRGGQVEGRGVGGNWLPLRTTAVDLAVGIAYNSLERIQVHVILLDTYGHGHQKEKKHII